MGNNRETDRQEREVPPAAGDPAVAEPLDFIREIVTRDLRAGKNEGRIATRFPPEPNGYLHIGHAKSICLNFGIAREFRGTCNLRFDDTNPTKEEVEYVEAIEEDVRWLGFDWDNRKYFASDYFEQLFQFAARLIRLDAAYVDSLSADEIREHRGTLTEPGRESPFRNRSVEENLRLFEQMKAGEFEDGTHVLRAKIEMTSPNINMRDPTLYRIRRVAHHRTGDRWCIYPMYDFAHALSDSIEGITHSICTLEFEDHRPLYDWFLDMLQVEHHPQQIEFARLNLTYTVLSKRKLLQLVQEGFVSGWDDPRMPTIQGFRRRGYTPEAIRSFCDAIGVTKKETIVDVALLEHKLREDLNLHARRAMCVLRPLRLVVENYPADRVEMVEAVNNPEDGAAGKRQVPFSRLLFIEKEDFSPDPPPRFFRLAPGRTVRLRYSYLVTCTGFSRDPESGEIAEVRCTYEPDPVHGESGSGSKTRATIHWVSAAHAVDVETRLYDRLFAVEDPSNVPEGADWKIHLNPHSLEVLQACKAEPGLAAALPGERYQFERIGYFCVDYGSRPGRPVFNRTVTLKDAWAKIQKAQQKGRANLKTERR